jgi:hypothetical protein
MRHFSVLAHSARMYLLSLADRLFGCRHRKTTMPMTFRPDPAVRGKQIPPEGTYIVCLGCGRHLTYNLRVGNAASRAPDAKRQPMGAIVKPDRERSIQR